MQKWEYMLISVVKSYGMNYRANGDKVNDWKDVPLHDVFARMGKAGFEFCNYDGENYIFKRLMTVKKSAE
ncbi:MAG: hypothetical protein ACFE0Q_09050 [Anaerolineae bacterium]